MRANPLAAAATLATVGLAAVILATPALGRQAERHGQTSNPGEEAMHAVRHGPSGSRSEVERAIGRLFEGMRLGDSTMVAGVVRRDAALITTFSQEGVPRQRRTPMAAFVRAVGTPHDEVWDERVWNLQVDTRDNLAAAWMDYAFFVGETFSHCGVNAMHLARREDGGWEIISLADTRTPAERCEIPESVRNGS